MAARAADLLVRWVKEREAIRLAREAGKPWPWTDDPVLRAYRFCNVRRMDDRVSRWLMDHWYGPRHGHPNTLIACALARFVNLPDALAEVGFPRRWEPERVKRVLRARRGAGLCAFNAAYIVSGAGGGDKVAAVVDRCVGPLHDDPPAFDTDTMQGMWQSLRRRHGFGSFMAGQVVADLRWAAPGKWRDRMEWAPVGPGSARGLARLYYGDDWPAAAGEFSSHPERWLAVFRDDYLPMCRRRLPNTITDRLEAMDYQNILCEHDKYVRAAVDGRRLKRRYTPGEVTSAGE